MKPDEDTAGMSEEIRRVIESLPGSMNKDLRFEVDQFLAKLELLSQKSKSPDFLDSIDRKAIRENLFEFLKDDTVYFLQKLLMDRQSVFERVPSLLPPHKEITQALKELNVTVYYPAGKDFSRPSILEKWYVRLWRLGRLSLPKIINFFDLYKYRLYSLTDNAPYEFSDLSRLVRRMLVSGDYDITFDEIYEAELILREEIIFGLLRKMTRTSRLEYLISKQIVSDLSDRFIRVLHEEMASQLREDLERARDLNKEVMKNKTVMDSEIKHALRIQNQNLQSSLPPHDDRCRFGLWYDPLMDLGGDYYHIDRKNEYEYTIFMADIAGHGLAAAMYTNTIRVSFEENKGYYERPEKLLRKMNEDLYGKLGDTFITAIFIHINIKKKILKYSNAGHPKAFLIESSDERRTVRFLRPNGKIMGIFQKVNFREMTLPLQKRNRLVVYTDGITESLGEQGLMLGEKGFLRMFNESLLTETEKAMRNVQEKLKIWQGTSPVEDDRTLIVADISPD